MTPDEALAYLQSFPDFERGTAGEEILTLDRMRRLLELLDHPDRAFGIVHIVGTKGKGSTAAMIASCLRAAGYRAGLFISPHLLDYRERAQVDGEPIPPWELASIVDGQLRPAVERLRAAGERTPLHFELLCALAFAHFRRRRVDVAVVEAGLGGRLDATNAVERTALTAITTIGYDHMAILGHTLTEIAGEKAAVVRAGGHVVSSPQPPEALAVIERVCRERGATLALVGRDWRVENVVERIEGTDFDVQGVATSYRGLRVPLAGAFQAVNGGVAMAALDGLREVYPRLDEAAVRRGLASVRWPGRLQVVAQGPLVILDAAHNRESAAALAGALRQLYPARRFVLVVAVFGDKKAEDILSPLMPLAAHVVVTATAHPRALPASELAAAARAIIADARAPEAPAIEGQSGSPLGAPAARRQDENDDTPATSQADTPRTMPAGSRRSRRGVSHTPAAGEPPEVMVEEAPSVAAALERARQVAGREGRVLVTGSLRTIGEAMVHWT